MSKAVSRIRRSKKLRATLQKTGGMRIAISRSLKNITAQLIDSTNGCVLALSTRAWRTRRHTRLQCPSFFKLRARGNHGLRCDDHHSSDVGAASSRDQHSAITDRAVSHSRRHCCHRVTDATDRSICLSLPSGA